MSDTAFVRIVDALQQAGKRVRLDNHQASAQCPAHDDRNPSLSVREIKGSALVHCHAGCDAEQVLDALGMTKRDLYDDPRGITYVYDDGRKVHRSPDKKFCQSGNRTTNTLFRLTQVQAAVKAGEVVYLVEGEKDVLALESIGVAATTAPMGASNVDKCDFGPLQDAQVVAVVDKDESGAKWAEKVRRLIPNVEFVEAFEGKDSADHIAAGHGVDQFVPYTQEAAVGAQDVEVDQRHARITWASQIEPEPVVWAWEEADQGRIPSGSLSIAAGREGTGKSSFGIWLTAQITRGTLPGSFYGHPRRVFYVAVEDSWKFTLVPRLIAAGADLSKVGRFEVVSDDGEEVTLSLPYDNHLLETQMVEHGVALVVIDPLMSVIGERIDTHREREVRSALDPLARIADRTGAVVLGIAHFNKGGGTDAASLITGSGAFKNVPRTVFGFARDETDENGGRVMSQVKNSLGRDDLPSLAYVMEGAEIETPKGTATTGKFVFLGQTDRTVADVLRDARQDPELIEERRDAASFIREYLEESGGTALANDVTAAGKAAGYPEKTLKNARSKVADTESSGFGKDKRSTWILRIGPAIGPIGPTIQKPGPMGPMAGPMEPKQPVEESRPAPRSVPRCPTCRKKLTTPESIERGDCGHPICHADNPAA